MYVNGILYHWLCRGVMWVRACLCSLLPILEILTLFPLGLCNIFLVREASGIFIYRSHSLPPHNLALSHFPPTSGLVFCPHRYGWLPQLTLEYTFSHGIIESGVGTQTHLGFPTYINIIIVFQSRRRIFRAYDQIFSFYGTCFLSRLWMVL